ncbi:alpha/beta fold hydrolase [Winogradskyella psychrotolerans]|uniref:alpha/beta fold hydrolase n=1 Tax=Winogradskyella psychrotolerans TaxID=1344585 RepID=UPI001C07D2F1|nr:alpha/beta hydrolase [Winogradskyella psychrotolerans]MBU2927257.1 alpha/beta hydrolase [Winogradskyella psychrotolerans]
MVHLVKKGSTKGTILCIHGNSSSPEIFQSLLTDQIIHQTIIAVELLGHSVEHQDCNIELFSTKNQCKVLSTYINTIDDDIFLLGNSLGGHLAIEIAKDIKRLKGLMIFGTPPVTNPINFEEAFNVVPALNTYLTENPTETDIETAAKVAVYKTEVAPSVSRYFKIANPLVRTALAIDITKNNWSNQKDIFLNLQVPKYIVAGNQDPTVSIDYLKTIEVLADNCELLFINNCGHYPTLEQPNAFIELLKTASLKVFDL